MSCRQHRYPWPSLATFPYRSSPPAGSTSKNIVKCLTCDDYNSNDCPWKLMVWISTSLPIPNRNQVMLSPMQVLSPRKWPYIRPFIECILLLSWKSSSSGSNLSLLGMNSLMFLSIYQLKFSSITFNSRAKDLSIWTALP